MKPQLEMNVRCKDAIALREFLQHIRDYDSQHHGAIEASIFINAPDLGLKETREIIDSISPPFPIRNEYRKQ